MVTVVKNTEVLSEGRKTIIEEETPSTKAVINRGDDAGGEETDTSRR